jgi:hypothetical protein
LNGFGRVRRGYPADIADVRPGNGVRYPVISTLSTW